MRHNKFGLSAMWTILCCLSLISCQKSTPIDYSGPVGGWSQATGSDGGGQYSSLNQIRPDNVNQLKVAWTYEVSETSAHTPDAAVSSGPHPSVSEETTPIVIENKMVMCTPTHRVIALDPETGHELWTFDPHMDPYTASHFCRGVAHWSEAAPQQGAACQHRILSATGDGRLIALDLDNGHACEDFGSHGQVNLLEHLGDVKRAELYNTTPPLIVKDLAIIGAAVHDGFRSDTAGGVVRAFDVRTGRMVWAFDPVPPEMQPVTAAAAEGGKTFTRGTPNVWTFMSADLEHGLVYLSFGNAPPDFFKGPDRPIDYFGSSLVALKIDSGEVAWHFKAVNHDLWDYDIAAQPVLYEHQGKTPAVALATKTGNVFLLNRITGEPLFPIEQRKVPVTDVPGEQSAPTQPFPTLPKPLATARYREEDVMRFPIASRGCIDTFRSTRNEGIFTPPSLQGSFQSPGVSGGFNWGSTSVNQDSAVFVGAFLNMPYIVKLVPRAQPDDGSNQTVPDTYLDFPQYGSPYSVVRFPFLSQTGIPCLKPPWGFLAAIDLNTGNEIWRRPIGSLNSRVPLIGSLLNVGVPVSGGVMQTATGVVFAAATIDEYLRAFDAKTGAVLWSEHLPFSAHSIPMTYRLRKDSKQFLVIATGGAPGLDVKVGDRIVAYTLRGEK